MRMSSMYLSPEFSGSLVSGGAEELWAQDCQNKGMPAILVYKANPLEIDQIISFVPLNQYSRWLRG